MDSQQSSQTRLEITPGRSTPGMYDMLGGSLDSEQNGGKSIDTAMNNDVLLKEDLIMKYLELIVAEDRHLLNLPYIHETGEEYIRNWRETVFPEYKTQLRNLVSKYSNRRKYQIRAVKNKVIAVLTTTNREDGMDDKDRKDSKSGRAKITEDKAIASIDKPVFMNLEHVMRQGHNALQSRRSAIRMQYDHLLSKQYLDEKDKSRFMKQRDAFIETLNAYYAVQYYANKINHHITYNKDVPVPIVIDYQQQGVKNPVPRVGSVDINVNTELIEKMYEQEGAKLDMYNYILELQASNSSKKELDTAVREYLQYDETNDIMKDINKQVQKLKNRQEVNWLVVSSYGNRPVFCKRNVPRTSNSKSTLSQSKANHKSH